MANDTARHEDDDNDQDELIPIEGKSGQTTLTLKKKDKDDDHDDDDHAGDDTAVGAEADSRAVTEDEEVDPEREAIRARRREEKKERKKRQDEARDRTQHEMRFLSQRNEQLERQFSELNARQRMGELGDIDRQINEAKERAIQAEHVHAAAITANNGNDAVAALRYRDEANNMVAQLTHRKAQQTAELQRQPVQQQPPARQIELAQAFVRKHDWYDPNLGNEDSQIVSALDNALTREGLNPSTPEYWTELESRIKRRLPERFKTDDDESDEDDHGQEQRRQPQGGPRISSGRNTGSNGGKVEVRISPERKQAMIEANVWEDQKLRDKYIRKYMEYDKQHARR